MAIKLSNDEIKHILHAVEKFLKRDNILYVGVDIPVFKDGKGYIDFTTDKEYYDGKKRRGSW